MLKAGTSLMRMDFAVCFTLLRKRPAGLRWLPTGPENVTTIIFMSQACVALFWLATSKCRVFECCVVVSGPRGKEGDVELYH